MYAAIIRTVAEDFANEEKVAAGVEMTVQLSLSDLSEDMSVNKETLIEFDPKLKSYFTTALIDCANRKPILKLNM
jgi:hypothetical protein